MSELMSENHLGGLDRRKREQVKVTRGFTECHSLINERFGSVFLQLHAKLTTLYNPGVPDVKHLTLT